MPTLDDIRSQIPAIQGWDDQSAVEYLQRVYYPDRKPEELSSALGVKPPPPPPVNQFSSGFSRSFQEVPGLAAGVAAFGADVVGATDTRDSLMAYAKRKQDALAAAHAQDASSFSDTWDGKTSWLDFLKNASGYVAGQALQTIATGGLGALGMKMLARTGAKELAEVTAAKAIAGGASEAAAKEAVVAALTASERTAVTRGAVGGAGAHNFGMELGSIYPEAVDEATKEGRQLDGGDLFRVFSAASLAAGVDTAGEAIMAGRIFKGSKAPGSILGRASREVPAGMAREAGTEAIQTVIEQYGAAKPFDLREVVDSAAIGAVGGAMGGTAASLRSRVAQPLVADPSDPVDPHTPAAAKAAATAALSDITKATTIDEALTAFQTATSLPLVTPHAPIDEAGAMDRLMAGGESPAPGATIDPDTGELIPAPTFKERLSAVKEQLGDSRVRQQIRETSGPTALNDLLYYVGAADNPNLPGTTSDRMVSLAEQLLFRAQVTPVPGTGGPVAPQLGAPAPSGTPQIGLDTTPTGTLTANAEGLVTPETNADQISLRDRARAMADSRGLPAPDGAPAPVAPAVAPIATPVATPVPQADAEIKAASPEISPPLPPFSAPPIADVPQPRGAFQTEQAALDYLSQQRRNGGSRMPASVPQQFEDGSWGLTQDKDAVEAATVAQATTMKERAAILARRALGIEPGDLVTQDDKPYDSKMGAAARSNKDGGTVVAVKGGWVVRPYQSAAPQAAASVSPAPADAVATPATPAPTAAVETLTGSDGKTADIRTSPEGKVSVVFKENGNAVSTKLVGSVERGRYYAGLALGLLPADAKFEATPAPAPTPEPAPAPAPEEPVKEVVQRDTKKASQRARQRMAFNPETDTLLQALAKMGGIQREVVRKEFGMKPEELKHTVSVGGLKGFPFRKTGGMSLDGALEALTEAGYFRGVPAEDVARHFEDAIFNEIGGDPTLTAEGSMRAGAEATTEAQLDHEERARRTELEAEVGLTETEMAALEDDAIDILGGTDDVAGTMRALGFTEKEIADEITRQGGSPESAAAPASEAAPVDDARGGEEGPAPAPEPVAEARPVDLIELRKRVSVLKSIKACLG